MLAKGRFKLASVTLAERISEALKISGVSALQVAEKCGIKPQSVYQWMSGETKQISGENLVEVAELTGYAPRWLAKEAGPKRLMYAKTQQQAQVLKAMQSMPSTQETLILKITDSLAEPPARSSNDG